MAGPRWIRMIATASLVGFAACGGGEKAPPPSNERAPAAAAGSDLTPFQLENGIGPITEAIALGPLDQADGGSRASWSSRPSAPPVTSSVSDTSARPSAASSTRSPPRSP